MKITELVKTYKLLNDPNAPEWNVKFVGGAILALGIIAAAGFSLYYMRAHDEPASVPAAATLDEGAPAPQEACTPEEIAAAWIAYKAAHPDATAFPSGEKLESGCIVA